VNRYVKWIVEGDEGDEVSTERGRGKLSDRVMEREGVQCWES
jgi:hypothetical protein